MFMTEQYESEVKHWQSAMHNEGSGENYIMICTPHPNIIGVIKYRRM